MSTPNPIKTGSADMKSDAEQMMKPGSLFAKWKALDAAIVQYDLTYLSTKISSFDSFDAMWLNIGKMQKELIGLVMHPKDKPKVDADKPNADKSKTPLDKDKLLDLFCTIKIKQMLLKPEPLKLDPSEKNLGSGAFGKITNDILSELSYFIRLHKAYPNKNAQDLEALFLYGEKGSPTPNRGCYFDYPRYSSNRNLGTDFLMEAIGLELDSIGVSALYETRTRELPNFADLLEDPNKITDPALKEQRINNAARSVIM